MAVGQAWGAGQAEGAQPGIWGVGSGDRRGLAAFGMKSARATLRLYRPVLNSTACNPLAHRIRPAAPSG